jgi:hypothetical protein
MQTFHMQTPRIGAVMVVQNDAETVECALASFYDDVEFLVVSTDCGAVPGLNWVVQVDADEVFLDFADFKASLLAQAEAVRSACPPWKRHSALKMVRWIGFLLKYVTSNKDYDQREYRTSIRPPATGHH